MFDLEKLWQRTQDIDVEWDSHDVIELLEEIERQRDLVDKGIELATAVGVWDLNVKLVEDLAKQLLKDASGGRLDETK